MGDRGRLVCVERHPGRAEALESTLRRQRVTCAKVAVADVLEFGEGGFDRVLLDPPCSGLGVLAGRPDARWRRTLEGAREVAALQRRMLEHARGLLAAGGRLVYSVCTIRRDECEGVAPGGRQTLPHRDHTDGFYVAVAS
jgi:16S rRNA (cytosine967-C5)-methyltransferase